MPVDYKNYPENWHELSREIRFNRAGNRCECEGECGRNHGGRCLAINGQIGKTGKDGVWRTENSINSLNSDEGFQLYGELSNPSKVVLTVAHLWKSECAKCAAKGTKCGIKSHLKAMCNGCHLLYDLPHHIANRRKTIARNKDANRELLTLCEQT